MPGSSHRNAGRMTTPDTNNAIALGITRNRNRWFAREIGSRDSSRRRSIVEAARTTAVPTTRRIAIDDKTTMYSRCVR